MANIQVIISPAKKMRVAGAGTPADDVAPAGIPPFPAASARLVAQLRAMDRDELQALWRTSDRLTDECLELTRALEIPQTFDEARDTRLAPRLTPAVLTYDGIQFRSMAPEVLDAPALAWLQDHLWILSGLHGCVRPLDAVMPYRLEMGAKLAMDAPAADGGRAGAANGPVSAKPSSSYSTANLYEFWGPTLAHHIERADGRADCEEGCRNTEQAGQRDAGRPEPLNSERAWRRDTGQPELHRLDQTEQRAGRGDTRQPELHHSEQAGHGDTERTGRRDIHRSDPPVIVNLASVEYAKAVLPHLAPGSRAITVVFGEELRGTTPVQRSTASKAARGSMVRWMAEHALEDPAELQRFDIGYHFDEALSSPDRLVFMHNDAPA